MAIDSVTIAQIIGGVVAILFPIFKKYFDKQFKAFMDSFFKWRERYIQFQSLITNLQAQILVVETKMSFLLSQIQKGNPISESQIKDILDEIQKLRKLLDEIREFGKVIFDDVMTFKPVFSLNFPFGEKKREDK